MTEKKRKFKDLPGWIGLAMIIPLMVVMIEYWYISDIFPPKSGLTKNVCWIVALSSGMLAGILFNWKRSSFLKNFIIGAIAGLLTGAASIWISGGYLYLRGFPDSLIKFELILIAALTILFGIGVSALIQMPFKKVSPAEQK